MLYHIANSTYFCNMERILVTYANREEFVQIDWSGVEMGHSLTGLGKTKSVFYLTELIHKLNPSLVLNVGTAGTIKHQVGDIFVCRHFIDRDMQKLQAFGATYEIEFPSEKLSFLPPCLFTNEGTCNTGDDFVTAHDEIDGDVIDMEGFAQAFVCQQLKVPFVAVKYVTDIIGQNSVKIWQDKISDAVAALRTYLTK